MQMRPCAWPKHIPMCGLSHTCKGGLPPFVSFAWLRGIYGLWMYNTIYVYIYIHMCMDILCFLTLYTMYIFVLPPDSISHTNLPVLDMATKLFGFCASVWCPVLCLEYGWYRGWVGMRGTICLLCMSYTYAQIEVTSDGQCLSSSMVMAFPWVMTWHSRQKTAWGAPWGMKLQFHPREPSCMSWKTGEASDAEFVRISHRKSTMIYYAVFHGFFPQTDLSVGVLMVLVKGPWLHPCSVRGCRGAQTLLFHILCDLTLNVKSTF
jgi:hypothetical protein